MDSNIDNCFGYREASKPEITSAANSAAITSHSLLLPSFLANVSHEGFSFEPFEVLNSLTKQYNSASSVLQNFSSLRPYMDISSNKCFENNISNSGLMTKYFDRFPLSDFPQSNYSSIPNLISSKPSLSSSAFQQFSPSYFSSLVSSGFTTLGSNSYTSSMNSQNYFNNKLGASDSLNNNFLYPNNLFSGMGTNKLASYPYTQGSTHIYPPYINNNMFSSNTVTHVLGNSLNQVIPDSAYSNNSMMSGGSNTIQSTEATESVTGL